MLKGLPDVTTYYHRTFNIPQEGVLSTYFLFGKHRHATGRLPDGQDDIVDDEDNENGRRALKLAHGFDVSQPHLLIKGNISFVNSFGYLSAD